MKKAIVFLLFLCSSLVAAPVAYTWDGSTDSTWETAANWTPAGIPGTNDVADTVTFNATAVECDLDSNRTLGSITMTSGYSGILDFNTFELDVAGACDLSTGGTIISTGGTGNIDSAGSFTLTTPLPSGFAVLLDATGNLATVSGNLAALIINHVGTTTFTNKGYWGSFTGTAGAINFGNFDLDVAGNISGTSSVGTLSNQGTWTITATAAASKWSSTVPAEQIEYLVVNAAMTVEPGVGLGCRKLGGSGSITGSDATSVVNFETPAANFWDAESLTLNIDVALRGPTPASPGSAITIASGDFIIKEATTWAAAGNITLSSGDLLFASTLAAVGFDMNGYDISCTNITIGDDENCTLTLGEGNHTVTGNIAEAGGAQTKTIAMQTSTIAIGGTFDGTGITVTAGAGARIAVGDNSFKPTLADVTVATPVDASGVLDGTGNSTGIRFARGLVGGGVF